MPKGRATRSFVATRLEEDDTPTEVRPKVERVATCPPRGHSGNELACLGRAAGLYSEARGGRGRREAAAQGYGLRPPYTLWP